MDIIQSKKNFVEFLSTLLYHDSKLLEISLGRFEDFSDLIHKHNNQFGLISDNDLEFLWVRHFQDSLMAMKLFPQLFNIQERDGVKRVIDIGSGSGFPGVPLAILNPSFEFILLEPNKKRGFFLEQILIRSLNLTNVRLVSERAEVTVKQKMLSNKFNLLITRAVAHLDEIIPITFPFLNVGGSALYWVSAYVSRETNSFKMISSNSGGEYFGGNEYSLDVSDSEPRKAIVGFKKI